ncbi:uncharacterized protein LOC118368082 isoform X2 [Oncorhynchus keta]|uniref:uncharacterized protein LOC118368082 isoform X2 n=1 Tax=Oncorhynchus keta TaxID=8018 RepID=UPI00227AE18A|nr:uncharacterized protein LOC118368082 isoform X2 [Oncorhynchus keta]
MSRNKCTMKTTVSCEDLDQKNPSHDCGWRQRRWHSAETLVNQTSTLRWVERPQGLGLAGSEKYDGEEEEEGDQSSDCDSLFSVDSLSSVYATALAEQLKQEEAIQSEGESEDSQMLKDSLAMESRGKHIAARPAQRRTVVVPSHSVVRDCLNPSIGKTINMASEIQPTEEGREDIGKPNEMPAEASWSHHGGPKTRVNKTTGATRESLYQNQPATEPRCRDPVSKLSEELGHVHTMLTSSPCFLSSCSVEEPESLLVLTDPWSYTDAADSPRILRDSAVLRRRMVFSHGALDLNSSPSPISVDLSDCQCGFGSIRSHSSASTDSTEGKHVPVEEQRLGVSTDSLNFPDSQLLQMSPLRLMMPLNHEAVCCKGYFERQLVSSKGLLKGSINDPGLHQNQSRDVSAELPSHGSACAPTIDYKIQCTPSTSTLEADIFHGPQMQQVTLTPEVMFVGVADLTNYTDTSLSTYSHLSKASMLTYPKTEGEMLNETPAIESAPNNYSGDNELCNLDGDMEEVREEEFYEASNTKDISLESEFKILQTLEAKVTEQDCVLPEQDCVLPEQDCVLPEQDCVLPEQDCVLPEQDCVLPEQDCVLPEQDCVLPEQDCVLPEHEFFKVSCKNSIKKNKGLQDSFIGSLKIPKRSNGGDFAALSTITVKNSQEVISPDDNYNTSELKDKQTSSAVDSFKLNLSCNEGHFQRDTSALVAMSVSVHISHENLSPCYHKTIDTGGHKESPFGEKAVIEKRREVEQVEQREFQGRGEKLNSGSKRREVENVRLGHHHGDSNCRTSDHRISEVMKEDMRMSFIDGGGDNSNSEPDSRSSQILNALPTSNPNKCDSPKGLQAVKDHQIADDPLVIIKPGSCSTSEKSCIDSEILKMDNTTDMENVSHGKVFRLSTSIKLNFMNQLSLISKENDPDHRTKISSGSQLSKSFQENMREVQLKNGITDVDAREYKGQDASGCSVITPNASVNSGAASFTVKSYEIQLSLALNNRGKPEYISKPVLLPMGCSSMSTSTSTAPKEFLLSPGKEFERDVPFSHMENMKKETGPEKYHPHHACLSNNASPEQNLKSSALQPLQNCPGTVSSVTTPPNMAFAHAGDLIMDSEYEVQGESKNQCKLTSTGASGQLYLNDCHRHAAVDSFSDKIRTQCTPENIEKHHNSQPLSNNFCESQKLQEKGRKNHIKVRNELQKYPPFATNLSQELPQSKCSLSQELPQSKCSLSQELPQSKCSLSQELPQSKCSLSQELPQSKCSLSQELPQSKCSLSQELPQSKCSLSQELPQSKCSLSQELPQSKCSLSQELPQSKCSLSQELPQSKCSLSQELPQSKCSLSQELPQSKCSLSQELPQSKCSLSQELPQSKCSLSQELPQSKCSLSQELPQSKCSLSQELPQSKCSLSQELPQSKCSLSQELPQSKCSLSQELPQSKCSLSQELPQSKCSLSQELPQSKCSLSQELPQSKCSLSQELPQSKCSLSQELPQSKCSLSQELPQSKCSLSQELPQSKCSLSQELPQSKCSLSQELPQSKCSLSQELPQSKCSLSQELPQSKCSLSQELPQSKCSLSQELPQSKCSLSQELPQSKCSLSQELPQSKCSLSQELPQSKCSLSQELPQSKCSLSQELPQSKCSLSQELPQSKCSLSQELPQSKCSLSQELPQSKCSLSQELPQSKCSLSQELPQSKCSLSQELPQSKCSLSQELPQSKCSLSQELPQSKCSLSQELPQSKCSLSQELPQSKCSLSQELPQSKCSLSQELPQSKCSLSQELPQSKCSLSQELPQSKCSLSQELPQSKCSLSQELPQSKCSLSQELPQSKCSLSQELPQSKCSLSQELPQSKCSLSQELPQSKCSLSQELPQSKCSLSQELPQSKCSSETQVDKFHKTCVTVDPDPKNKHPSVKHKTCHVEKWLKTLCLNFASDNTKDCQMAKNEEGSRTDGPLAKSPGTLFDVPSKINSIGSSPSQITHGSSDAHMKILGDICRYIMSREGNTKTSNCRQSHQFCGSSVVHYKKGKSKRFRRSKAQAPPSSSSDSTLKSSSDEEEKIPPRLDQNRSSSTRMKSGTQTNGKLEEMIQCNVGEMSLVKRQSPQSKDNHTMEACTDQTPYKSDDNAGVGISLGQKEHSPNGQSPHIEKRTPKTQDLPMHFASSDINPFAHQWQEEEPNQSCYKNQVFGSATDISCKSPLLESTTKHITRCCSVDNDLNVQNSPFNSHLSTYANNKGLSSTLSSMEEDFKDQTSLKAHLKERTNQVSGVDDHNQQVTLTMSCNSSSCYNVSGDIGNSTGQVDEIMLVYDSSERAFQGHGFQRSETNTRCDQSTQTTFTQETTTQTTINHGDLQRRNNRHRKSSTQVPVLQKTTEACRETTTWASLQNMSEHLTQLIVNTSDLLGNVQGMRSGESLKHSLITNVNSSSHLYSSTDWMKRDCSTKTAVDIGIQTERTLTPVQDKMSIPQTLSTERSKAHEVNVIVKVIGSEVLTVSQDKGLPLQHQLKKNLDDNIQSMPDLRLNGSTVNQRSILEPESLPHKVPSLETVQRHNHSNPAIRNISNEDCNPERVSSSKSLGVSEVCHHLSEILRPECHNILRRSDPGIGYRKQVSFTDRACSPILTVRPRAGSNQSRIKYLQSPKEEQKFETQNRTKHHISDQSTPCLSYSGHKTCMSFIKNDKISGHDSLHLCDKPGDNSTTESMGLIFLENVSALSHSRPKGSDGCSGSLSSSIDNYIHNETSVVIQEEEKEMSVWHKTSQRPIWSLPSVLSSNRVAMQNHTSLVFSQTGESKHEEKSFSTFGDQLSYRRHSIDYHNSRSSERPVEHFTGAYEHSPISDSTIHVQEDDMVSLGPSECNTDILVNTNPVTHTPNFQHSQHQLDHQRLPEDLPVHNKFTNWSGISQHPSEIGRTNSLMKPAVYLPTGHEAQRNQPEWAELESQESESSLSPEPMFHKDKKTREIERLRKEREQVMATVQLNMNPHHLTLELTEAKLHYGLGEMDTLLKMLTSGGTKEEEPSPVPTKQQLYDQHRRSIESLRKDREAQLQTCRRTRSLSPSKHHFTLSPPQPRSPPQKDPRVSALPSRCRGYLQQLRQEVVTSRMIPDPSRGEGEYPPEIEHLLRDYGRAREEAMTEISRARERLRERTEQEKRRLQQQTLSQMVNINYSHLG